MNEVYYRAQKQMEISQSYFMTVRNLRFLFNIAFPCCN